MILHTASEGVTLSRKLEEESAEFYEEVAKRHGADAEALLAYAKENKKNVTQIERAYYGVITDALEGGYAFNLNDEDFVLKLDVGADYAAALRQAMENEKIIINFYNLAAEQGRALMADLPRTFTLVVRKHNSRLEELGALAAK